MHLRPFTDRASRYLFYLRAPRHHTHNWWWPSFWRPEWSAPGAGPPTRSGPDEDEPPGLPAGGTGEIPRVIQRGGPVDGVVWEISAWPAGPEQGVHVSLRTRRGEVRAAGGTNGPRDGRSIGTMGFGASDDFPPFVLVFTTPAVAGVVVHGLDAWPYPVTLSAPDTEYAVRVGAAPLRDGDWPMTITVRTTDGETWSAPYFTPSR